MNKKALFPLLLLLAGGVFFSFQLIADQHHPNYGDEVLVEPFTVPDGTTYSKNQAILLTISRVIGDAHYSPRDLNDDFSKRVFERYLEMSDYGK
ncbi:MAG TPA: hypothetical protein PLP34_04400, partial [Chitinophagaceae bacterium]|nr:hypothetical protein [Chitinophagaceae bacterium]